MAATEHVQTHTGCTLWPDTGLWSGLRVKLFLSDKPLNFDLRSSSQAQSVCAMINPGGVLVSLGGDRYGPICLLQWVWPLTQTVKNCGLGAYRGPLTESGCWSRSGCSRIQEDCVFSGIFSFASLWKLSGVEIKRRHACRNDGQSDTASHHLSRLLSSTRLNTHPEKSSSAPNLFHVVIFNLLKIAFTLN